MTDLLKARKKSDKKSFWKYLEKGLISKKNIKRDLIIWLGILLVISFYFGLEKYFSQITFKNNQENGQDFFMGKKNNPVLDIKNQIDTQDWILYKNDWYGFELKYPEYLNKPMAKKPTGEEKWEQKIVFSFKNNSDENTFEGFEVLIYDTSKIKELTETDDFPKLKNPELISEKSCFTINNHLLGGDDYSAKKIYIPANDNCYEKVLFFTNNRDKYIYNIIPTIKKGKTEEKIGIIKDPQQELIENMPEFFVVVSTWRLIDIYRPKPKPIIVKPKITAPMPVSYKKVNGLRVCAKKNDKPGKSKQGKGKHMDMECCLDPDEYPNPHCYYDPKKYGKYLK